MGDEPDYIGHRERLRKRFVEAGPAALADYELLELVLFLARPRRDVKPLAKALLKRFGSFAEVIGAEAAALREVKGVAGITVIALKAVEAAAVRLAGGQVIGRPVLATWQKLMDYCHAALAYKATEEFHILYLNRKNVLISDERQQKGTVDHAPVYPREVVKRALELEASALIMVHNHPSGDPTPSQSDIEMTREVKEAAAKLGIAVHDHVIVSKGGYRSFKTLGLL